MICLVLLATAKRACLREPGDPMAGVTCTFSEDGCLCSQRNPPEARKTCGAYECCYQWWEVGHAHSEVSCGCNHGYPETHACAPRGERQQARERVSVGAVPHPR